MIRRSLSVALVLLCCLVIPALADSFDPGQPEFTYFADDQVVVSATGTWAIGDVAHVNNITVYIIDTDTGVHITAGIAEWNSAITYQGRMATRGTWSATTDAFTGHRNIAVVFTLHYTNMTVDAVSWTGWVN